MMVLSVKFVSWDKSYYFLPEDIDKNRINVKIGDNIIVDTVVGSDAAKVIDIKEIDETEMKEDIDIKPIIRVATEKDLEMLRKNNLNNHRILRQTRKLIRKFALDMKLSDIHVSYDNKMIVFAFIADGRIDFRDLVKTLSKKYKKKIRLYQLGVRDEAKFFGNIGDCGQALCCRRFLDNLESITTGFARDQQVSHRGLDKLSGICGRLKCCLAYEEKNYKEMIKDLPNIGDKIRTKQGHGIVTELNPLKRIVKVRLEKDKSIMSVQY